MDEMTTAVVLISALVDKLFVSFVRWLFKPPEEILGYMAIAVAELFAVPYALYTHQSLIQPIMVGAVVGLGAIGMHEAKSKLPTAVAALFDMLNFANDDDTDASASSEKG